MSDNFDELDFKSHEKKKIREMNNDENYKKFDGFCDDIVNSYFKTQAYTENQQEINFGEDLFNNNNNDNNNGQNFHIDE